MPPRERTWLYKSRFPLYIYCDHQWNRQEFDSFVSRSRNLLTTRYQHFALLRERTGRTRRQTRRKEEQKEVSTMPRRFLGIFLRLLRGEDRRRQQIARRRRGVRIRSILRRYGGRRHGLHRFGGRGRGFRHGLGGRHGAGPSGVQAEPAAPPVMPKAMLNADEAMEPADDEMDFAVVGVEPALAAPPPPERVDAGAASSGVGLGLRLPSSIGRRLGE